MRWLIPAVPTESCQSASTPEQPIMSDRELLRNLISMRADRRVLAPSASSTLTISARNAHRALPERRRTVQPQDRHIARTLTPVTECGEIRAYLLRARLPHPQPRADSPDRRDATGRHIGREHPGSLYPQRVRPGYGHGYMLPPDTRSSGCRAPRMIVMHSSYDPTRATAGQAATAAPTGPWPSPCATFAGSVAAIPRPSLRRGGIGAPGQAGRSSTGSPSREATSISGGRDGGA
jgi:hypothetical protein